MSKPKEGRSRKSALDFSCEAGRTLWHALNKFEESGVNPFLPESYQSEEYWKSKEVYQQFSFGSFLAQAPATADIVIKQMKPDEIEKAQAHAKLIRGGTIDNLQLKKHDTAEEPKKATIDQRCPSSLPKQYSITEMKSLRDTIVAPYPNNKMAIVIFELYGDVRDASAFELKFSEDGNEITIYGRVPKELTKAALLLGMKTSQKSIQDGDCMVLDEVIKKRLKGNSKDKKGNLWEIRDIIALPFSCKPCLFNKYGDKIEALLMRKNNAGYTWGYFWVIGQHVGREEESRETIRCKATSDAESECESNHKSADNQNCDDESAGGNSQENGEDQNSSHIPSDGRKLGNVS